MGEGIGMFRHCFNFNQLSLKFTKETGFSVTKTTYMKRWYIFCNEQVIIHQQVVDDFG